jgi:hypothetical protein
LTNATFSEDRSLARHCYGLHHHEQHQGRNRVSLRINYFILLKTAQDWEFPGNTTTEGQSNYFWQGLVTQPNHGNISTGLTDTFANYHDYTVR